MGLNGTNEQFDQALCTWLAEKFQTKNRKKKATTNNRHHTPPPATAGKRRRATYKLAQEMFLKRKELASRILDGKVLAETWIAPDIKEVEKTDSKIFEAPSIGDNEIIPSTSTSQLRKTRLSRQN